MRYYIKQGDIIMKRLLVTVLLGLSAFGAQAHPYGYYGHGPRYGWVAPFVIGGAVGYALTRPVPPPPVVVYQQPVPVYPNSIPPAPYGYHYQQIIDGNCNCYRWVIVPN